MADVYTDSEDELVISQVINFGFHAPKHHKYLVFRLALARSLRLSSLPDKDLDFPSNTGKSYSLEQITGKGKENDGSGVLDFDDAAIAILSVYHEEDLFSDLKRYKKLLQRHIRRGLREIRTSWSPSHDFFSFLQEEIFAGTREGATELSHGGLEPERLLEALVEIGVQAEIKEKIQGARIDRYNLFLPQVGHFDALRRGLDKLAFSLGLGDEGVFIQTTSEPKVVGLDIPRQRQFWQPIDGTSLFTWAEQAKNQPGLPIWLGQDVLGHDFSFDLAEAPHLLIAGTTGSGKSVTLHALILSLLQGRSPEEIKLAFIDPKLVELSRYQGIPQQYGAGVAHLATEAMQMLKELIAEMEKRNQLLDEIGASNLSEAIDNGRLNLPRIVVIIEELADLFSQSRELEAPLVRLAQKARSVGIHLVLATQRPDATTFSGLLRTNIPGRIALRVQKGSESRIILDETGAEKLLGVGDMLVKVGTNTPIRIHGAYISQDDIKRSIRYAKGRG
ncbi:MAG: DndE family protein [Desulfobulbaceae bacterium]|nr:DndE family protein [Desulfobulbaceae bacterium]